MKLTNLPSFHYSNWLLVILVVLSFEQKLELILCISILIIDKLSVYLCTTNYCSVQTLQKIRNMYLVVICLGLGFEWFSVPLSASLFLYCFLATTPFHKHATKSTNNSFGKIHYFAEVLILSLMLAMLIVAPLDIICYLVLIICSLSMSLLFIFEQSDKERAKIAKRRL